MCTLTKGVHAHQDNVHPRVTHVNYNKRYIVRPVAEVVIIGGGVYPRLKHTRVATLTRFASGKHPRTRLACVLIRTGNRS